MSVCKVVRCVIFGDTFYRVYLDAKGIAIQPREYAGGIFESENQAQEYANKLNREARS